MDVPSLPFILPCRYFAMNSTSYILYNIGAMSVASFWHLTTCRYTFARLYRLHLCFLSQRKKKNNIYPVNLTFPYIKCGYPGFSLHGLVNVMYAKTHSTWRRLYLTLRLWLMFSMNSPRRTVVNKCNVFASLKEELNWNIQKISHKQHFVWKLFTNEMFQSVKFCFKYDFLLFALNNIASLFGLHIDKKQKCWVAWWRVIWRFITCLYV